MTGCSVTANLIVLLLWGSGCSKDYALAWLTCLFCDKVHVDLDSNCKPDDPISKYWVVQELLKHYGTAEVQPAASRRGSRESTPTESNMLFLELPSDIQDVVRPYLESKFQLAGNKTSSKGIIFMPAISFRKWLYLWMRHLVVYHSSGQYSSSSMTYSVQQTASSSVLS